MKKDLAIIIVILVIVTIAYFNREEITSQIVTNLVMPKTRAYNNCNPGNIRLDGTTWQGEVNPSQDPDFKQFISMDWGYRAIFVNLRSYINSGINTINTMINTWAPASDNNDTTAYINSVVQQSGYDPNQTISVSDADAMQAIAKAISYVESGVPAIPSQVSDGWTLFLNS